MYEDKLDCSKKAMYLFGTAIILSLLAIFATGTLYWALMGIWGGLMLLGTYELIKSYLL